MVIPNDQELLAAFKLLLLIISKNIIRTVKIFLDKHLNVFKLNFFDIFTLS